MGEDCMDYISIKEAAEIWEMDTSNIGKLARKGKIEGAKKVARNWLIPKNTPKPIDGRTRETKAEEKSAHFRFPLYVNLEETDFAPPLSPEEVMLRTAQKDFYACNFDKAKIAFINLLNDTKSVYVKIICLFYLCSLSVDVYAGRHFKSYYHELQVTLAKDFPYKKEMEIVTPWLNTVLVQFSSVSESLNLNVCYYYSPSVIPLISYLSFYHIAEDLQKMTTHTYYDTYELLCRQIELTGAYYEACEAHLALFCAYCLVLNEEAMLFHLRSGMNIAMEHNLPLLPACYFFYYFDAFQKIIEEYPKEFVEKIKINSKKISESISKFTEKNDITKIYSCLSSKDYRYILFALNGCTNKQVAQIMNISERTATNRYSEIFNKLGISGKKQLIELIDYKFRE